MPCGRIERIDDIGLYFSNGSGQKEVLRKVNQLAARRVWCARIRRVNGEWTAKKDGGPSIMHHNNGPQANSQLAFLFSECLTLLKRIVMQA